MEYTYFPNEVFVISVNMCVCVCVCTVWKNSMPKLHEVIRGSTMKIYCQATTCQTCICVVLWIIEVGPTKVRNQAKPLNYSKKEVVFCTNLEQMFKRMATELVTQLTQ